MYFFRIPPRSKNLSLSDGIWTVILLPRLSIHLNKSLTSWKAIFVETLYSEFLSAKFDNESSTFFLYHLRQKFFLSQTVLRQLHSSLEPQFIWICPSLGWKAIYVETLHSEFLSAKFDVVSSTFFVYHLGQKIFLYETVFGQWYCSPDSQFIWISP